MATALTTMHVVPIRYEGHQPARPAGDPVDAYTSSDAFAGFTTLTTAQPAFPEDRRQDEPTDNLGVLGGEIADAVAAGLRAGAPVTVIGGNCASVPGVVGGVQEAHGPAVRVGLVWFDAHGDFNTPKTTLSGMLGGMPVAVAAGLGYPRWREWSKQPAPLPTDRIVMVDVRNLDEPEARLIAATDVVIAAPAAGFPGVDLGPAIADLAARVEVIYLHIDSDILDERFVPNHRTREPNGPDMAQVMAAVETVLATGKVGVFALVSVWADGEGGDIAVASGTELLTRTLALWQTYGAPSLPVPVPVPFPATAGTV